MASPLEFCKEQMNYYKICYVVTDVLTEGLRAIFKREWDKRFKETLGEWKDEPKNGIDFRNSESPQKMRRNARLLATMQNGDRAEWDCSMLFYAILFSDCICGLNPTVRSNVDDLRRFRNEEFAHMSQGHLSDEDFQNAILKINTAFHVLGLPTEKIREIQTQTSFPTEELTNIRKKVDNLQQEVIEKEAKLEEKENQRLILEEQLQTEVFPFCILPPGPTHEVVPRRSEVDKITQHLIELKDENKDSLSTLYLSGNPGSGKSVLARLTAKRFFDESKETPSTISFVMTLNAESSETLLESYISFAQHCKCAEFAVTNTRSSKDLSIDEKIVSLKTLVSTKIGLYTSWLLVVDDVTSLSRVLTYLPGPGNQQWMGGQLLITTQDTESVPSTSPSTQHISVSKGMFPDDASSLLRLLSGVTDDKMERKIAQRLDYQPLALASAAIYVRQFQKGSRVSNFGWTDFLNKLEKGQRYATEVILAETNPGYSKTMTMAIRLVLQKVLTSDRALDHLFTFLSLCAPQPILKDIVVDYIMEMEKEFEDKDEIEVKISRCPLLLLEEEESCVYIKVHGVVHYVVNSVTRNSARDKRIKSVLGALSSFCRFQDQDSLFIGTKIVPHLAEVIRDAERLFSKEGIPEVAQIGELNLWHYSNVFTTLGRMCYNHSQYQAAKSYFGAVLTIIKLRDPSNELEKTNIYNHLGLVHRQLGNLEQAKDFHKRALDVLLEKLGPEHVDVATSFNNLGLVHWKLSDLKQAEDLIKRALDIRLKKLGPEHISVSTIYNNLSLVYRQLGDLKQAKDCHERALDIRLKRLGPEHVEVASSYSNLGLVYRQQGDLKQAKDCHERALNIQLKKLGPEHVDVAMSNNNLGLVQRQLGDLQQARDFHKRALDIQLKKLGPGHVDVAMSYNNLAFVHRQLGDLQRAKDFHERALDIQLGKLGPEHVSVSTSYKNLGLVYRQLGDLKQARDFHKRALDIELKKLGPEHVDVAVSYNNLGLVLWQLGDLRQAKDLIEQALDIWLKKLGPKHVYLATSYSNLGAVLEQLGDLQQAKDCHERALDVLLKKLGPKHVDVARSYNNLGLVLVQLGDLKRAKDCHERAVDVWLKTLDPEHVDAATSYNNLGAVLEQLGDLQQAKHCHERALDIRQKKLT
ncbi:uncharacterized protein LOC111322091 [Stylophora pistillata]|nr:uncharacterized protein LOC111322091 [Stylophora pistillata]